VKYEATVTREGRSNATSRPAFSLVSRSQTPHRMTSPIIIIIGIQKVFLAVPLEQHAEMPPHCCTASQRAATL
jgi:hypothetical protein